jgi:hypothetical protein
VEGRETGGVLELLAGHHLLTESGAVDPSRVRIPGPRDSPFGKLDYLLGRVGYSEDSVSKGRWFGEAMRFTDETLERTLIQHVVENAARATISARGTIEVIAPVATPRGVSAQLISVWQVSGGALELITAYPVRRRRGGGA